MKSSLLQKLLKVISAFALILFFANNMKAQVWCPPGASWHYNGDALMLSGYHELTYSGDSIVSSQNCQKIIDRLEGHGFPSDINAVVDSFYTYSQSGVVYIYNNRYGLDRFDTLFNINANIGDKWRMPLADTTCDSVNITVLNTGTAMINSFTLKWLFVKFKPSNASSYINDTIKERIGFVRTFFYFPMVCQYIDERMFDGLRCYSDDAFGSYTTGISTSCNYYYTGINEKPALASILCYPNPASSELTIQFKTNYCRNAEVVIKDVFGRVVKRMDYKLLLNGTNEMHIEIGELSSGIYFLHVISGATIFSEKFIKK